MINRFKLIENGIEYDVYESDIYKTYSLDGKIHRELGPSQIWQDGSFIYNLYGKFHREDGLAIFLVINGKVEKAYCLNGIAYSDIKSDEEWKSFIKLRSFE